MGGLVCGGLELQDGIHTDSEVPVEIFQEAKEELMKEKVGTSWIGTINRSVEGTSKTIRASHACLSTESQ